MPKKRGNNEGTIRQRQNGTWEARYTSGYDQNGKLIQNSLYAPTREEAQRKMQEAIRQINRGEYVEPDRLTVAEWLNTWFQVYGRPRWRESTAAEHYRNIQGNLIPALGRHLLQKLRPEHIQAFVNKQAKSGFAPASIRKQLEPLKSALKQAAGNLLIQRNPSENISLPRMEEKDIEFLTIEEQQKLLPAIPSSTTYGRALRFILGTGLRASELCGLRWIDIYGDHFTVKQGVQRVKDLDAGKDDNKYKLSIAPPKTRAGKRSVPLTSGMRALLDEQAMEQRKERLEVGEIWRGGTPGQGDTYVFASSTGVPMDRCNLGRALRLCLDTAGLKHRGLHALRHTFATNCIRAGVDVRTLAEIIGHTKIAFTIQRYIHSDMNTKRAALEAVDRLY